MSGNWPFDAPKRQGNLALQLSEEDLSALDPSTQALLRQLSQQRDRPVAAAPSSQAGSLTGFPSLGNRHAPLQRPLYPHVNTGPPLGGDGRYRSNTGMRQQPYATAQQPDGFGLDGFDMEPLGQARQGRPVLQASYNTSVSPILSASAMSTTPAMSQCPAVRYRSPLSRTISSAPTLAEYPGSSTLSSAPTLASSSRLTRPPSLNDSHFADALNWPLHPQAPPGQQPSQSGLHRQQQPPVQKRSPYFSASSLPTPETRPSIALQQPRHPPKIANRNFNTGVTQVLTSSSPVDSDSLSSPAARASLRREMSQNTAPSSSNAPDRRLLALDHAPPIANGIKLVNPREVLPDRFRDVFPYDLLNAVQSKCFDPVYQTNDNVVISAPTGSGKTAILELAICRLARLRGNENFKIVYLSPLKALCSERASDWSKKFSSLTLKVAELTGDTSQAEMARVRQASIIITTPEKWDSITRSWTDHRKLLDLVELFLIDEVHLLQESRGSTLEAVVSRMKIRGANVRFIALSATVPNSDDVAKWLGKDHTNNRHLPARQEIFGEEFRPVKLQKFVYGFDKRMNDYQFDDFLNAQLYPCIEKHSQKKPILVFCQSRKSCQEAASKLAEEWNERQPQVRPWPEPRERILVVSPELQEILRYGVAFHHAGLEMHDRKAIEQAFLDGLLSVICCTSTLAMGLNLPCHMVVLKGTKGYLDNKLEERSDLETMQMLGRAGRPQFGTSAVAVVLTRAANKRHYEEMGSSHQILESTLHQNLIEHLNSEINLGTFQDIHNAKDWLKGTFLAVRLSRNPAYYKLTEATSDTKALDDRLEKICEADISKLRDVGLITSEETFHSTDYGRAMSKYVIQFNTMKKILEIPRGAKMEQLLNAICEADEFKDLRWKSHEREVFRDLNKDNFIVYPIKETVSTTAHKVSLLVQVELGKVVFSNVPQHIRRSMVTDTHTVLETMHRLIRAVIECKASDSDGVGCRVALELERSISATAWEGRSIQLTQVPQVGPVLMRRLVAAGITTVSALAAAGTGDIERIASRNPPFGKKVLDDLSSFPSLTLETRITGSKPRIQGQMPIARIDAILGFSNTKGKPKWNGRIPSVTFIAETTQGELPYWWRGSLRKFREEDGNKMSLHFEVELRDFTEEIICHFSCDEIVGTVVSRKLQHDLPASAFPPKPRRQTSAESRKPAGKIPAIKSWLDDEIGDDDMLEMVHEEENAQDHDRYYSDALEDEDLWPVIDRDGDIQRKELAPQGETKAKQRELEHSQTDGEEPPWQPVQLPNGKYKCNHHCAFAMVKSSGRACTHKCCREGVDKPRRPKRTSHKRKVEDDEVIADLAPMKHSGTRPTSVKRVATGGNSRPETNVSSHTPVNDLSASVFKHNNPVDLDFDVDDEGIIDLTKVEDASDDNSMDRGVQPALGCSQSRLRKGQSTSADDVSGDSVFDDSLAIDESDIQVLDGNPAEFSWNDRKTTSSSAKTKHLNYPNTKPWLDKKNASPIKPALSNNLPVCGGSEPEGTELGDSNYFEGGARDGEDVLAFQTTAPHDRIHGPHEQGDDANWDVRETEEEALASMSQVFSENFVDRSASNAVGRGDNASSILHSPHGEQTPKDTDLDAMALQTPQDGGAADEEPPYGHESPKESKKRFDWLPEADQEFLDEYLDVVEIVD